jgi:uncharacterized protein YegL
MAQDLMILRQQDLVSNPSTRLPVCLCLDVSGSMNRTEGGTPTGRTEFIDGEMWNIVEGGTTALQELIKGVEYFFDAIKSDEIARYSVELSIVVFGDKANTILEFANIDRQSIPSFTANGNTAMNEGVNLALDLLEQRKGEYSSKGVDYYQPWMVLMTDGYPTDNTYSAINRVKKLGKNKKLTLFPVSIGHDADMQILKQFSTLNNDMVLKVKSAEHFKEFFEWLSQSIVVASQSVPGDKPQLPPMPPVIEIEM